MPIRSVSLLTSVLRIDTQTPGHRPADPCLLPPLPFPIPTSTAVKCPHHPPYHTPHPPATANKKNPTKSCAALSVMTLPVLFEAFGSSQSRMHGRRLVAPDVCSGADGVVLTVVSKTEPSFVVMVWMTGERSRVPDHAAN